MIHEGIKGDFLRGLESSMRAFEKATTELLEAAIYRTEKNQSFGYAALKKEMKSPINGLDKGRGESFSVPAVPPAMVGWHLIEEHGKPFGITGSRSKVFR